MSSIALNDINIDELFFDSACININPSRIIHESPIKGKNQFSILNINIRSLSKNFSLLLTLLKLSKIEYTIIVITETWLHDSDNGLFNIPGYDNISLNRPGTNKGGGIRLYYHNSIKFIKTDNDMTGISDSHECLSCEFDMANKYRLQIIGIYRPPKNNLRSFINHIKSKKIALNPKDSKNIKIIAGDMNISYAENFCNLPRNYQEYFEIFTSNSFKFHITKPTRLGRAGAKDTSIDHIWSNSFMDSFPFTINYKISDHIPCAVTFDFSIPTIPQKVKFFDFSLENIKRFIPLKRQTFEPLMKYSYQIENVDPSTDHIFSEIMAITKKYFPVRTQQISLKKMKTPWLTKNMIKSLRIKHKLFEMYKNHEIEYHVFRNFSNILRRLINQSKTNYEKKLFNDLSGNTRGIWKRINSLMRPNDKSDPPFITDENNVSHSESNQISNSFIQHLDSAPEKLLENISESTTNYSDNIKMNCKSMLLFPATPNEIINIINDLKNNNNINDIPTKILKLASEELSVILANLFNKMVEVGEYPKLLKFLKPSSRTGV